MTTANVDHDKFFSAFSAHLKANHSRVTAPDEREKIRNADRRIRRLDSLARLINTGINKNCVAVTIYNNQWYATANKTRNKKEKTLLNNITIIVDGIKNGSTEKYLKMKLNLLSNDPKNRSNKDVCKLIDSMSKANPDCFTENEIKNIKEKGVKLYENPDGIHAEMRLLHEIFDKVIYNDLSQYVQIKQFIDGSSGRISDHIKKPKLTLGISKLCCRLCSSGVSAIKIEYQNLIDLSFRGRHGNFYFDWKPISFLLDIGFEKFVGQSAYEIYNKASDDKIKGQIIATLKDLKGHQGQLLSFFKEQIGATKALSSDSPLPNKEKNPIANNKLDTSNTEERKKNNELFAKSDAIDYGNSYGSDKEDPEDSNVSEKSEEEKKS